MRYDWDAATALSGVVMGGDSPLAQLTLIGALPPISILTQSQPLIIEYRIRIGFLYFPAGRSTKELIMMMVIIDLIG